MENGQATGAKSTERVLTANALLRADDTWVRYEAMREEGARSSEPRLMRHVAGGMVDVNALRTAIAEAIHDALEDRDLARAVFGAGDDQQRPMGWVITTGRGRADEQFMCWRDGVGMTWTVTAATALYFARRGDAEAVGLKDDNARSVYERPLP